MKLRIVMLEDSWGVNIIAVGWSPTEEGGGEEEEKSRSER